MCTHPRYDQLEPFLDDTADCRNAARHYICASWFPKCTRDEVGLQLVTVRDVCESTCRNYFYSCGRNPGSACDGLIGAGPNDPVCTGAAASTRQGWMLVLAAVATAAVIAGDAVVGAF